MDLEKLQTLVNDGLSSLQIAQRCGYSGTAVRYWLRKHGLKTRYSAPFKHPRPKCEFCDTSVSRKGDKYCSVKCSRDQQYKRYIDRWKTGLETGNRGKKVLSVSGYIRRYLTEKYSGKCSRCGWAKKNPITNRTPLTIEHIDGNWTNTTETNLDLICPNCHSLTPTYGALNKGYGRSDRYKTNADEADW